MNLSKKKIEFFTRITREIQAPVSGMLGVIGLLENTRLDEEQLEYISILKNGAQSLAGMVSDLNDYSKIDSGEIECSLIDFDLRTTLIDVQKSFDHKIQKKGLEFIVSIHHLVPSLLRGDPERLRQILKHLLDNAVAFTQHGEIKVCVILGQENQTHATIRFEIADTGIGIEPEKLKTLFDGTAPRENDSDHKTDINGMGLTMVRQLVQIMEGEIEARSTPGQGSVFRLVIKFEKQSNNSENRMIIPATIKNKKILIVDNDAAHRLIVKEFLKSWGCLFEETVNATLALEKLKSAQQSGQPFDIILVDMQLPGMNGEDLAGQIREHSKLSRSLIIMLAAMGKRGDVNRLNTIGVQGYLPKPTQAPLLFDCITMALAMSRQKRKEVITRHFIKENQKQQFQILLIDSVRVNQKIVKNILEKSGYTLKISQTSQGAVDAFIIDPFKMVLIEDHSDVQPLETIKKLRQIEQDQARFAARIILITERNERQDSPAGCDGTISKPFTSDNLLMTIEHWMDLVMEEGRGKSLFQRAEEFKKSKDLFDIVAALERAMDDKDFLKTLVEEFINSFPGKLDILESSLRDNDFKTFIQRIYSLRSSALNIGSNSISAVALELEKCGDVGDIATAEKLLKRLGKSVQEFKSHIETIDWSRV